MRRIPKFPPSYPECESLDSNEQKKCFIESIEKKLIAYFNDRNIILETSEYLLKINIDTLGCFSIVQISSKVSLSDEIKMQFNIDVHSIITIHDILKFIGNDINYRHFKADVEEYIANFGV